MRVIYAAVITDKDRWFDKTVSVNEINVARYSTGS